MVYWFRDTKTGYGWLGHRVAETFPETHDIVVATPFDAPKMFPEAFEEGKKPLVLCAVDSTDLPPCWLDKIDLFSGIILMLDHSDFKGRYPFVLGEWYPCLRFWGRSAQWKPRGNVLGTIAQIHGRKGFQYLPELAARLKSWQFEIITDFKTKLYLTPLARSFPNIHLMENNLSDDELLDWFTSLRGFFSLSMGEGGGLPAFEAAYIGVPTILPYHTAYKFVPNATFYSCTPVQPFDLQLGGNIFAPDLQSFIDNLKSLPEEQRPAQPPFKVEPDWGTLLPYLNLA